MIHHCQAVLDIWAFLKVRNSDNFGGNEDTVPHHEQGRTKETAPMSQCNNEHLITVTQPVVRNPHKQTLGKGQGSSSMNFRDVRIHKKTLLLEEFWCLAMK